MGYFTTFAVTAQENGKEIDFSDSMKHELAKITQEIDSTDIDELAERYFNSKWYSYDSDVKLLSEKFPNIVFTVEEQGEDSDDLWKHYFFNGKSQFAKGQIVYPQFDEKILEDQIIPDNGSITFKF